MLFRSLPQDLLQRTAFFTAIGVVTGDGGLWLQKQCMILARNNNTPVPYWLSLPLWRLGQWIKTNNVIVAEEKKEASNGQ